MPRSLWVGSIGLGLVNVPVRLYAAVSPKEVHFHQLHGKDGARIEMKRYCSAEQVEVPFPAVVKGYALARNRYVTVSAEELESIEPKATRLIELEGFVPLAEIDPVFFEQTYWAGPEKGGVKAFALLREALRETGRVGLARFVLHSRKHLCVVRPFEEVLAVTTLLFGDEIVSPDSLELGEAPVLSARERSLAIELVEAQSFHFHPEELKDDFRERLLALIERKAEGKEIVAPRSEAEEGRVVDLFEALERSVAATRKGQKTLRRPRAVAARTARAPRKRK